MIFYLFSIVIVLWLIRSYCGWLISSILSLVTRCQISVGDVRWLRLLNVRIRLRNGITIYIDDWSLQFFSQTISKPLLLKFGDVRIEADTHIFSNSEASETSNTNSSYARFTHLVQYCGIAVNSVQLVLLDAIPGCMLHMSGDELLAETFRSREGWQLELSSRLMHGKIYRRRETSEPLLACALSMQLSIDVSGGSLIQLGIRLADPSFNVNRGIIDVFQEFRERNSVISGTSKKLPTLSARLQKLKDATISINNGSVVYTACNAEQRKSLSLKIGEVNVQKKSGFTQGKITSLALSDHLHNTIFSANILSTEITETNPLLTDVLIRSDSIVTAIFLYDVLWWKEHFLETAASFRPSSPLRASNSTSKTTKMVVSCTAELDSMQVNISDGVTFRKRLSIQLLTVSKKESEYTFGTESLTVSDGDLEQTTANYRHHTWGHTIYVGVALAQFIQDPYSPMLNISIDEFKAEWIDKLADQVESFYDQTFFL